MRTEDYAEHMLMLDRIQAAHAKKDVAITVRVRNVYGNRTVYPVCDKAKIFAQLAGHSTLTSATLDGIRRLGYLIEVQQELVEV
jgi:hypothetical protein